MSSLHTVDVKAPVTSVSPPPAPVHMIPGFDMKWIAEEAQKWLTKCVQTLKHETVDRYDRLVDRSETHAVLKLDHPGQHSLQYMLEYLQKFHFFRGLRSRLTLAVDDSTFGDACFDLIDQIWVQSVFKVQYHGTKQQALEQLEAFTALVPTYFEEIVKRIQPIGPDLWFSDDAEVLAHAWAHLEQFHPKPERSIHTRQPFGMGIFFAKGSFDFTEIIWNRTDGINTTWKAARDGEYDIRAMLNVLTPLESSTHHTEGTCSIVETVSGAVLQEIKCALKASSRMCNHCVKGKVASYRHYDPVDCSYCNGRGYEEVSNNSSGVLLRIENILLKAGQSLSLRTTFRPEHISMPKDPCTPSFLVARVVEQK